MAEPISDSELANVRGLVDIGLMENCSGHCAMHVFGARNESSGGYPWIGSIRMPQVASIIARLDRAEAEVAKVRSEPASDDRPGSLLDIEIGDVGFPTHVSNRLLYNNIRTVRDLVSKTPRDLTRMRHIGRKSLLIINSRLSAMGLSLKEIPGIAALKAAGVEP